MSEPAKMRVIAVGAALLALVFTLVAVIVVVTRESEPAQAGAKGLAPLSDRVVKATDVVRVQREQVELVVEQGIAKGVRVKDATLRAALGLEEGDIITAISGKALLREYDAFDVMSRLSLLNATTLYVEVTRKDQTTLLRWKLDGDLREAKRSTWNSSTLFGSTPSMPSSGSGATTPDDALLDTIEKIDDLHYKVPRKVIDALLADTTTYSRGVRIVPAVRNGKADGFKLYAMRPTSLFARIGLVNGDTVQSINGIPLTTADKALEIYTKLKDMTSMELDIARRGQPFRINVEITK